MGLQKEIGYTVHCHKLLMQVTLFIVTRYWCRLHCSLSHAIGAGYTVHCHTLLVQYCSLSHAIGARCTVHCQTLLVQVTLFTVTRYWCRLHCSLSHAIDTGYHVRCSQSIDRLKSMFNHFAHSRIP